MKLTATLFQYLAKTYLINMLFLLLALMSLIYLFDTVELLRRASKFTDVPLGLVLQMGLLKLPEVGQVLFPFAILFSAMFTFWQLSRRSELVIVRSSGFSVWQFLAPIVFVALLTGIVQMTMINPLGAVFLGKFDDMERKYLAREQKNQIAFFKEGLWLREASPDEGYIIIHAPHIEQPDLELRNAMVLFFDNDDRFLKRVDAESGMLETGRWVFKNAVTHGSIAAEKMNDVAQQSFARQDIYALPTNLTRQDVEESFSSPASMSFWRLPSHIETLEEAGFDASRLRVRYQGLLAQPFMFAAMVLLAATVSMRPPRQRGNLILFGAGIFIGFIVFFLSSFLEAMGGTGQIPVVLAAWAPAISSLLIGLSVLMRLEDG